MPITRETIQQDLGSLSQDQLQQVADFIAFLKFRPKRRSELTLDQTQLALLSTEFAEDDRALAEAGMGDYAAMLHCED